MNHRGITVHSFAEGKRLNTAVYAYQTTGISEGSEIFQPDFYRADFLRLVGIVDAVIAAAPLVVHFHALADIFSGNFLIAPFIVAEAEI